MSLTTVSAFQSLFFSNVYCTTNRRPTPPHLYSCLEEGPDGAAGKRGYMHWVERPVHTEMYTLRAGMAELKDDVTHYVSFLR